MCFPTTRKLYSNLRLRKATAVRSVRRATRPCVQGLEDRSCHGVRPSESPGCTSRGVKEPRDTRQGLSADPNGCASGL